MIRQTTTTTIQYQSVNPIGNGNEYSKNLSVVAREGIVSIRLYQQDWNGLNQCSAVSRLACLRDDINAIIAKLTHS